jgi:hypothetical protein
MIPSSLRDRESLSASGDDDTTGSKKENWASKMPLWAKHLRSSFLRLLDTVFLSLSQMLINTILTAGVTIVGASDLLSETGISENFALGIVFALCKASFRALADILDEYFMHDTHFPPILMIGGNSFYGSVMGLPLYLLVSPSLG